MFPPHWLNTQSDCCGSCSPGGQNPSVKLLQGLSAPWRAHTLGSISPHTGAHRAEASRGSWWSPTEKSRRQARSLRYSLLVQTGKEALTNALCRQSWLPPSWERCWFDLRRKFDLG
uniref:Uncharacterized protein n=1 Tax=Athene cunicularia TaxID=194338 RepID=A0A663MCQ2_ATHCN